MEYGLAGREPGATPRIDEAAPGAPAATPTAHRAFDRPGGEVRRSLAHCRAGAVFEECFRRGASDLILACGEPPVFRVHGVLQPETAVRPLVREDIEEILQSLLGEEQLEQFHRDGALDFSFTINEKARFRANCFFQRGNPGGAFRLIPRQPPRLEDLGLRGGVRTLTSVHQGLVLVTGPTGSGKSTTLAAVIDAINSSRGEHIITIEDPIEYVHPNKKSIIEQREVGSDTPSFTMALKHVLRQDPDVILIGEMRDLDTIATAITAAETGHLVLATLHTNDCVQTIDRIIDVFPPAQQYQVRSQLSSCLLAILNQRLLPRADRPGRVLASEFLLPTTAIRALIREGKTHQIFSEIETGSRKGMHTMDQDLARLLEAGLISLETADSRALNPRSLTAAAPPRRRFA